MDMYLVTATLWHIYNKTYANTSRIAFPNLQGAAAPS